jgi:hypothetical protein
LAEDESTLAAQRAWCDQESSSYLSSTAERDRELEIMGKLKDHLVEKFSAVSDYVSSRL